MTTKLYAYGNGSFGCLFDHVDGPFASEAEAAEAAAETFSLRDAGREELARSGFLNLVDYRETFIDDLDEDAAEGDGADYIEIFEVDENWSAENA